MNSKTQMLLKRTCALVMVTLALALPALTADRNISIPPGNWGAVRSLEFNDEIVVLMVSGEKVKGRFIGIDEEAIRLRVNKEERAFPLSGVEKVWRPRVPDRKLNGLLLGAAGGTAAGLIAASATGALTTGDTAGRQWGAAFVMAGLGIGALLGTGIDVAIKADRLIYTRSK